MAAEKAPETPKDSLLARFIEHAKGPMGLGSIGKELAYAVTDIRQKVVEEGMYGRQVTPTVEDPHGGKDPLGRVQLDVKVTFEDRCREVADSAPTQDPGHDRGHDR